MKGISTSDFLLFTVFIGAALFFFGGGLPPSLTEQTAASEPIAVQAVVGSTFSYQGFLEQNSSPIDGQNQCDGQFSLWNAASSGSQFGSTQTITNIDFNDGYFTVDLNDSDQFGSNPFTGTPLWLQIAIRCPAGSGSYTTLGRQALNATPYALHSLSSSGPNVTQISANTTLTDDQAGMIEISGATTVTLPDASTVNVGTTFILKNVDTSGNTVTISGTLDDRDNPILAHQDASITIVSDGSRWNITGQYEPLPMILYNNGTATTGQIAASLGDVRSAADALCAAEKPAGYTNARALISVQDSDEIRDMPGNYNVPVGREIRSKSDQIIADTWNELLDGDIEIELENAGMNVSAWYSGSNSDGSLSSNNCSNWTSASNLADGQIGRDDQVDNRWISDGNFSCDFDFQLLCIAH